jgi:hypothetical protein
VAWEVPLILYIVVWLVLDPEGRTSDLWNVICLVIDALVTLSHALIPYTSVALPMLQGNGPARVRLRHLEEIYALALRSLLGRSAYDTATNTSTCESKSRDAYTNS